MTRHISTFLERQQARTTAELTAEVLSGELSGRIHELALMVTQAPKSFTAHHAARLRNAAQVAQSAADLIDGGIKYERPS